MFGGPQPWIPTPLLGAASTLASDLGQRSQVRFLLGEAKEQGNSTQARGRPAATCPPLPFRQPGNARAHPQPWTRAQWAFLPPAYPGFVE